MGLPPCASPGAHRELKVQPSVPRGHATADVLSETLEQLGGDHFVGRVSEADALIQIPQRISRQEPQKGRMNRLPICDSSAVHRQQRHGQNLAERVKPSLRPVRTGLLNGGVQFGHLRQGGRKLQLQERWTVREGGFRRIDQVIGQDLQSVPHRRPRCRVRFIDGDQPGWRIGVQQTRQASGQHPIIGWVRVRWRAGCGSGRLPLEGRDVCWSVERATGWGRG